ncbi:MAG: ribosomal-protein-serine acetyltransferase [Actinomycetota bacterium]|jgi:RimJ/RimL family protein N-acetyltransferase|nr:ribosomal-protein-serine acetyltransferase [Actinomycetota bacterium]
MVMVTPAQTLTDGEVTLRRWQPGQVDVLHHVVSDSVDHLAPWLIWAVGGYGEREAAEFLGLTTKNWANGEAFEYAITTPDGDVIGGCGLMRRIGPGGLEIGYWLSHRHTGCGVMTKAVRLLVDEAFRIGVERVEILHDVLNVRSGAVPERLGFTMIEQRPSDQPATSGTCGIDRVWRLSRP